MSYNVLLSDAVSDYLKSQDRGRQKAILKQLYEMRNDPFKGNVIRLKPPLHRLYRKRIGNDRVLFSIRGEDVYLELMGDRSYVYELARGWNGILDEMMLLLHKLSIDPSIVLISPGRASPHVAAACAPKVLGRTAR